MDENIRLNRFVIRMAKTDSEIKDNYTLMAVRIAENQFLEILELMENLVNLSLKNTMKRINHLKQEVTEFECVANLLSFWSNNKTLSLFQQQEVKDTNHT